MKIKRGTVAFTPIILTFENLQEARAALSALVVGKCRMGFTGFTEADNVIVSDLITLLKSEGIREL